MHRFAFGIVIYYIFKSLPLRSSIFHDPITRLNERNRGRVDQVPVQLLWSPRMLYFVLVSSGRSLPGNGNTGEGVLLEFLAK